MIRLLLTVVVVVVAVKATLHPARHTVFPEYADAGRDIWTEEPLGFVARQYLPFFSIAMTPFALLPERLGCLLWAVLNLVVYFTGLRAFQRLFVPSGQAASYYAAALLVGGSSLWNQQANALIAGCLLWGSVAVARERWWLAALGLGLPAFKLYPLALGLVYAAFAPRLAWRLAVVVSTLVLLPVLFLGPEATLTRYGWIAEYAAEGVHSLRFNLVGVRELLMRHGYWFDVHGFFFIQAFTGAWILIALFVTPTSERLQRGYVLTSLWFVTFGPSVEAQTYLLAAPTLGWLLAESQQRGAWLIWGFLVGVGLVAGPAQTSLLGSETQEWLAQAKPACVLLTLSWLGILLLGQRWSSNQRKRSCSDSIGKPMTLLTLPSTTRTCGSPSSRMA
ncbi:MAG: glycosyltransferase family 87 protein, partial [Gemmataceae bacterium]